MASRLLSRSASSCVELLELGDRDERNEPEEEEEQEEEERIVPKRSDRRRASGSTVPSDEGRKSWLCEVTMSMKRSLHMPTWMKSATIQSARRFVRTRLAPEHLRDDAVADDDRPEDDAYGPNGRATR